MYVSRGVLTKLLKILKDGVTSTSPAPILNVWLTERFGFLATIVLELTVIMIGLQNGWTDRRLHRLVGTVLGGGLVARMLCLLISWTYRSIDILAARILDLIKGGTVRMKEGLTEPTSSENDVIIKLLHVLGSRVIGGVNFNGWQ